MREPAIPNEHLDAPGTVFVLPRGPKDTEVAGSLVKALEELPSVDHVYQTSPGFPGGLAVTVLLGDVNQAGPVREVAARWVGAPLDSSETFERIVQLRFRAEGTLLGWVMVEEDELAGLMYELDPRDAVSS